MPSSPNAVQRRWTEEERNVLVDGLVSGLVRENMPIGEVPEEVVSKLPGRSSDAIRQFVTRNAERLIGGALDCDELINSLTETVQVAEEKPRKRVRINVPKRPLLQATKEAPPPEMIPPLPRTITYGAKRMRLQAHGFLATYLCELPGSSFKDMNNKLGMQRDARLENWDGLPRFM